MTWTMKDLREAIRLRRAGWTYAHIAGVLGRPHESVRVAIAHHAPGLKGRATRGVFAPLEGRFRALHGRGHSDPAIAAELGVCPYTVSAWRRRLGLPSNAGHPRQLASRRAHMRRVVHAHGRPHLYAIREEVARARCAARGWPGLGEAAEADLLDLLCDRGPLTAPDLARLRGRGRSVTFRLLRRLAARGLVVKEEGARAAVRRPGRARCLYRLADGVTRHVPTRERGEGRVSRYREREG